MKINPGDIIILHKCNKNYDNMLYCSWDMARDGCNFYCPFWAISYLFTPLTAQKIKNKRNTWRYHHLTHDFTQIHMILDCLDII